MKKSAVLSKQVGDIFQILWPSHNFLTLIEFQNSITEKRIVKKMSHVMILEFLHCAFEMHIKYKWSYLSLSVIPI